MTPSFACWSCQGLPFPSYWAVLALSGILDLHKVIEQVMNVTEQVMNALQYHVSLVLVLGLPSPGAHTKNMTHKISILDGPELFCRFGHSIALVQTGQ